MRRSVVDMPPELQRTYMAAFHLVARRRAHRQDRAILDSEIGEITHHDPQTTRAHLLDLGHDLLQVAPASSGHLCVQGMDVLK